MIDLSRYSEPKPHRLRLILWRILNATLFPLLPNTGRCLLLRLFGAALGESLIHRSVRIYAPWNLLVGNRSCVGPHAELYCKAPIVLGDDTVISQGAYLCTASHDLASPVMALTTAPIRVGNGCWVAARAALLPGVTLGDGAVVGLGAVVTRPVPALTIVAGNPAHPIRQRVIRQGEGMGAGRIRIFCVDHRPNGERNPLGLTSLGVGGNRQEGILHDNDGKSIAHLNPHLNEATALWWVWQHPEVCPTDFVGFCHYRRFLMFRPLRDRKGTFSSRCGGCFLKTSLYGLLGRLGCGEKEALRVLEAGDMDGILPLSGWVKESGGLSQTLRDNRFASEKWIARAVELVGIHAPECAAYFSDAFRRGERLYPYNTFVVRTALFEGMCARLFPAVLRLSEEWRRAPEEKATPREPGFLTEFLVGTYWRWLEETGQARFLHCQCVAFLTNGHSRWYLPFSRYAYRFLPDRLAAGLSCCHRWLVRKGLMPHP